MYDCILRKHLCVHEKNYVITFRRSHDLRRYSKIGRKVLKNENLVHDLASQHMYWLLGAVHWEFFIEHSSPLVFHPYYSLWEAPSNFSYIQKKVHQMERDFRKCYIRSKCNKGSVQHSVKKSTGDISISDRTTDSCVQPEGNYCEEE